MLKTPFIFAWRCWMCAPKRRWNSGNFLWLTSTWNYNRNVIVVTQNSKLLLLFPLLVCLLRLHVERCFTHHRISQNVASLNTLFHDMINLWRYEQWRGKWKCFCVYFLYVKEKKIFLSHNSVSSAKTPSRCLQTSWMTGNCMSLKARGRYAADVFKTSWRPKYVCWGIFFASTPAHP